MKIIISVIICFVVAFVGSAFTTPSIPTWYQALNKPSFNPPNWIFGPVWTLLFLMMGIAAGLVWMKKERDKAAAPALYIYYVQLALNVLWSFIFFTFHSPFYAFIEIILLWLAILATIIMFAKVNKAAAWLLVPYILWVSFAAFLNFSIVRLNP